MKQFRELSLIEIAYDERHIFSTGMSPLMEDEEFVLEALKLNPDVYNYLDGFRIEGNYRVIAKMTLTVSDVNRLDTRVRTDPEFIMQLFMMNPKLGYKFMTEEHMFYFARNRPELFEESELCSWANVEPLRGRLAKECKYIFRSVMFWKLDQDLFDCFVRTPHDKLVIARSVVASLLKHTKYDYDTVLKFAKVDGWFYGFQSPSIDGAELQWIAKISLSEGYDNTDCDFSWRGRRPIHEITRAFDCYFLFK